MLKIYPKVKENTEIADAIYKLVLEGDFPQSEFKPGKFLHVKCSDGLDPLLRRPMSICDISDDAKSMTVLYRSEGRGTELMSRWQAGRVVDMLAPLGNNFDLDAVKTKSKIVLVGCGIGVPPLYYLGRKLKEQGHELVSILGFNSSKDVFYEKEFASFSEKVYITTVDGSQGMKGFVTHALSDLGEANWGFLYSCGPTAMLKALQSEVPENKTAYMSLEERMGCGVGACLACVCKYSEGFERDKNYSRVCTEGPVYSLQEVKL